MAAGLTVRQDARSTVHRTPAEPECRRGDLATSPTRPTCYIKHWECTGKSYVERLARAIAQARRHDRAWLFDADGNAYIFALPTGKVVYHPRD